MLKQQIQNSKPTRGYTQKRHGQNIPYSKNKTKKSYKRYIQNEEDTVNGIQCSKQTQIYTRIHWKRHGQRIPYSKQERHENKLKEIRSTDTALKQERPETSLKETRSKDTVLKKRDHSHTLDEKKPPKKKKSSMKRKWDQKKTPYKSNNARNKAMLNRTTKFKRPKKPHYQRQISKHDV